MPRQKKVTDQDRFAELALLAAQLNKAQVSAQAMVGIRNISDYTIGIEGRNYGVPDVHLHAAFKPDAAQSTTVIPFTWWRDLRAGSLVADGMLVRDDSILGAGYASAPEDRPEDIAAGFKLNVVYDPFQWIDSRNESELRRDIEAMTSVRSLRRLRRAVDDKVKEIAATLPDVRDMTPASNGYMPQGGWDTRRVRAFEQLPALYRLVDELTTRRIEA